MIARAVAGAAAGLAMWPVAAGAAEMTFCVKAPGCSGVPHTEVQPALDAAVNNPGPDRVIIGPGTFNAAGGNMFYADPGNPVQITGAGRGRTVLTRDTSGGTVLILAEAGVVARDLSVRIPASGISSVGLVVQDGAVAERVAVTSAPGLAPSTGVNLFGGTLRNSSVDMGTVAATTHLGIRTLNDAQAGDVAVTAPRGLWTTGSTTLRNLRVVATTQGMMISPSAAAGVQTVSLERAQIRVVPRSGADPASGIRVSSHGGASLIGRMRHVTLAGPGTGTGIAAHVEDTDATTSAGAAVNDSVISGFATHLRAEEVPMADGASNVSVDSSAYDFARVATANGGQFMSVFGNVDIRGTGPRWIDAGGNLRPRFNSPLVDRGAFGGLAAGESNRDLAGLPRIVDGNGDRTARRDMGAFEYQRARPVLTVTGAAGRINQPLAFSARASDPDPGEVPAIRWRFDDGATASGAAVHHAFTRPGPHTATVTATDPAGNPATRTLTVNVLPAPVGLMIARRTVTMSRRGVASVALTCAAGVAGPCRGTLTLRSQKRLKPRRKARARRLKLGSKAYSVPAGRPVRVKVKLSRTGRAVVRRRKRVGVTASTTVRDQAGGTRKASARFAVKAPKPKRRRKRR